MDLSCTVFAIASVAPEIQKQNKTKPRKRNKTKKSKTNLEGRGLSYSFYKCPVSQIIWLTLKGIGLFKWGFPNGTWANSTLFVVSWQYSWWLQPRPSGLPSHTFCPIPIILYFRFPLAEKISNTEFLYLHFKICPSLCFKERPYVFKNPFSTMCHENKETVFFQSSPS